MSTKKMLLLAVLAFAAIVHVHTTTVPAQNTTCPPNQCCDNSTITVYGSATLQVIPDQALIQASISVNANTTQLAVSTLATSISRVSSILNANAVPASGFLATSFNIYPNSSYINGASVVVGQIAT